MLGRLLHLGTGSGSGSSQPQVNTSRTVSSLESVQEDIHTRNLLYPDAHALFQHRIDQVYPLFPASTIPPTPSGSSAAFDTSDDVDLDVRDVRVLVMQDTLGHMNASLLYDSHPPPPSPPVERPTAPVVDHRRTPPVSRKGSLGQPSRPVVIQSENTHARPGAFDRRGSHHSRSHSFLENDSQRATREYREELATFAGCIFGNSELMSYKGTSTKVHVVPTETRSIGETMASIIGDGRSSIGRSGSRSSKLSQSFTSQTFSPTAAHNGSIYSRPVEKKKVLITRLFPVVLPDDSSESTTTSPQGRFSDDNSGYPFPATADDPSKRKTSQPRQRRTPMYAVVLVVQLPSSRASTGVTPKSTFRESGSYNEQDFFSSSYNSTRPSWWTTAGLGGYGDATESSFSTDVEDRIDALTQHWDIVMRTLSHLQSVVSSALKPLLIQADVASPDPFSSSVPPSAASSRNQSLSSSRRSAEMTRPKPPKSTVKLLSLGPNCLSSDVAIATEVNLARRRLVTGLKAARVVTGQGRWGIWRDEAMWTYKWTQSLGQGPFLYNLLTGFLATHTDWLQALCPPSYRRRFQQRKAGMEEDLLLPARTIIVADDKMAARRLVFLLSAFLPANQQPPVNRAHRSSTSMSTGGFSNSSPTFVIPVLREESLRRKINKRAGARRASHSRTGSQSTKSSTVPSQLAHLSMDGRHERRASDAASIRTTSIAMPGNDLVSRKSSAATTGTIMPEAAMPHFATAQRAEYSKSPRPDSSGSIATDDLKRSLQRRESSGHASTISTDSRAPSSRWGSVISGLWSQRRQETTSMGSLSQFSEPRSPIKMRPDRRDKLSQMAEEAARFENSAAVDFEPQETSHIPTADQQRRGSARDERISFSQADRKTIYDSPVKTSVNEDDGVIDVDFPFPDYIASFESAISSPSSSGYLSTPGLAAGLDSFEQSSRTLSEGDLLLNAVGWLSRFHPDFALQAIPPQDDLVDQVKATLRAEPTPGFSSTTPHTNWNERWVDVSSAVIADTTTNTVRRIHYRRLVKPRVTEKIRGGPPHLPGSSAAASQAFSLPLETQLDEEFIEEMILKPEPKLVEAIDKVISQGLDLLAKDGAAASFILPDDIHGGSDSDNTIPAAIDGSGQHTRPSIDMPRVQCKTIVLSALEEVIRDVVNRQDTSSNEGKAKDMKARQNALRGAVREWVASLDAIE
ncbi:unnamed protein product [Clonostachys byssicola]|uniref:Folliculin-interacting protein N-terminal domain-containing protein n=1 Tax=Clonostachys byssicola TaxID=160290 RepID=A0A9N9URE1_9HYPO|nr:unnamed protein product [Clonostachys byssicola]